MGLTPDLVTVGKAIGSGVPIGATLVGEPSQAIEFIAPGDSQAVSFDLVSNLTGRVTAATLAEAIPTCSGLYTRAATTQARKPSPIVATLAATSASELSSTLADEDSREVSVHTSLADPSTLDEVAFVVRP